MKGTLILSSKWDKRFMQMAKFVSTWSKDPSTQVGSIAVRNRTVIAQGYNGFPRGIKDDDRYNDREIKYKFIVHSEMNAIYNAAQNGVSLEGSTIYTYGLPICHECAKGLIQVGVARVVSPIHDVPQHWKISCGMTKTMFEESKIKWDWVKI